MLTHDGAASERHGLAMLPGDPEKAAHALFAARALMAREPWDACLDIKLRLAVFVPMPRISLQSLLGLKAGSVLETGWHASQDVPLLVEDVSLANVELEPVGERLGVRINAFTEQARPAASTLPIKPSAAPTPRRGKEQKGGADEAEERRLCAMDDLMLTPLLRFGETSIAMRDVLGLCVGDTVILDRPVIAPVSMVAGGRVIAQGDLVLVNAGYAIRIDYVSQMSPHLPPHFSPF